MNETKDCMYCKHSFYEDLDYNLCCRLKDNHILQGVVDDDPDDGFDDSLHFSYEYSYPNTCEHFELKEIFKDEKEN